MKYFYSLTASILMTLVAYAQPTYNSTDINPQVGDQLIVHDCEYQSTMAGSMMVWDLSGLNSTGTNTNQFLAPNNFPNSTQYPGATVALGTMDGATFFQGSAFGFYLVGINSDSLIIPYSDTEQILAYPLSMGTSWNDAFAAQFDVGGNTVQRTGDRVSVVDGYGDVILPWGTVSNVLRVRHTRTMQDSSGFMTIPIIIDYFNDNVEFFKAGIHWPVAGLDKYSSSGVTGSIQDSIGFYVDQTTGIDEDLLQEIGIDIFPNPAMENIVVNYSVDGNVALYLEIFDATGRSVRVLQESAGAPGIRQSTLNVSDLPSGIYTLRIRDRNGESGKKMFIMER